MVSKLYILWEITQVILNLLLTLSLKSVLHAPRLSINLLFSITKDLKCHVTFFPTDCVFQDQEDDWAS